MAESPWLGGIAKLKTPSAGAYALKIRVPDLLSAQAALRRASQPCPQNQSRRLKGKLKAIGNGAKASVCRSSSACAKCSMRRSRSNLLRTREPPSAFYSRDAMTPDSTPPKGLGAQYQIRTAAVIQWDGALEMRASSG